MTKTRDTSPLDRAGLFTIEERDTLSAARTRLRTSLTLLSRLTLMRDALNTIDMTFAAADERDKGGAR